MTKNEKLVILKSVVTSFCTNGHPFTSVEVANHLKKLGVWIRNRYVAEFLRENVLDISDEYGIDYIKSMIHVDSFGTDGRYYNSATCYHPRSMDVTNYNSRDLKAITPEQFEAIHGFDPFEKEEEKKDTPELCVKKGGLAFNFPGK